MQGSPVRSRITSRENILLVVGVHSKNRSNMKLPLNKHQLLYGPDIAGYLNGGQGRLKYVPLTLYPTSIYTSL